MEHEDDNNRKILCGFSSWKKKYIIWDDGVLSPKTLKVNDKRIEL